MLYRQWMWGWVGYYSLFIRTWGWWGITVTRIFESEPNYPRRFTYHECGRFVVKDTTQLSLCCTSWMALSPYISAHARIRWSFICLFSHRGTHPDLGAPVLLYYISSTYTKRVFTFSPVYVIPVHMSILRPIDGSCMGHRWVIDGAIDIDIYKYIRVTIW